MLVVGFTVRMGNAENIDVYGYTVAEKVRVQTMWPEYVCIARMRMSDGNDV